MYNSYYTTANNRPKNLNVNPAKQYLIKEIMEASPEQLVVKAYDMAISFCLKHNLEKTNATIQVMINFLKFDDEKTRELSISLYKIYQYCQESTRNGNYDNVHRILTELRSAWIEGIQNMKARQ